MVGIVVVVTGRVVGVTFIVVVVTDFIVVVVTERRVVVVTIGIVVTGEPLIVVGGDERMVVVVVVIPVAELLLLETGFDSEAPQPVKNSGRVIVPARTSSFLINRPLTSFNCKRKAYINLRTALKLRLFCRQI